MAEQIGHVGDMYLLARLFNQTNAPATPPNAVRINCAGIVTRVDLSALPPGTLIDSYVTGEFFKINPDHWTTISRPLAHYTDEDVATQVRLGWDADLEQTDFNLIHMGE